MKGNAQWRLSNKMQYNNQPVNKRQLGGEVDKRQKRIASQRWRVERTRGDGGAITGAM
jgi:hypothetical protein